ncbi:MAG: hypothetical protein ACOYMT_04170 [Chthoniobacterales bacterium]
MAFLAGKPVDQAPFGPLVDLESAARILRDMVATGAGIIDVDHLVPSMATFAPFLGPQQVAFGKTAPVSVIQNGTPAQIMAGVRECRAQAAGRVA